MKRLLAVVLLLAAPPAWAASSAELFDAAQFPAAASAGRTEATPMGLTIAARATLVQAAYFAASKEQAGQLIDRAEADADAALARKPGFGPALMQKGIAIGYRAKLGRSPGLAKQARSWMDKAAAADPQDFVPTLSLAGWHGEAIADLGAFLAGTAIGAKKSEALRLYEAALVKGKTSPTAHILYAFTLIKIDDDAVAKSRSLLERGAALPPLDGFDRVLQPRVAPVLDALRKGDGPLAARRARLAAPFGQFAAR